jgi:hypothetical protein
VKPERNVEVVTEYRSVTLIVVTIEDGLEVAKERGASNVHVVALPGSVASDTDLVVGIVDVKIPMLTLTMPTRDLGIVEVANDPDDLDLEIGEIVRRTREIVTVIGESLTPQNYYQKLVSVTCVSLGWHENATTTCVNPM